jgi:hypothetical protein
MTTSRLHLTASPASPRSESPDWRVRWRRVRELLSGALILAVWLSLWTWIAFGVAAPLGRIDADGGIVRAAQLRA